MTILDFIILAIPAVFAIGTFYSAGELIRRRMHHPDAPPHPFLDDLRGLEDAFVDFFASSRTSSGILSALAAHKKPIGFKALAEKLRGPDRNSVHHDEMPLTAVRAVLKILLFARLARMSAGGFSITELGREVHRRMRSRGGQDHPRRAGEPSERDLVMQTELRHSRSIIPLNYAGTRPATGA